MSEKNLGTKKTKTKTAASAECVRSPLPKTRRRTVPNTSSAALFAATRPHGRRGYRTTCFRHADILSRTRASVCGMRKTRRAPAEDVSHAAAHVCVPHAYRIRTVAAAAHFADRFFVVFISLSGGVLNGFFDRRAASADIPPPDNFPESPPPDESERERKSSRSAASKQTRSHSGKAFRIIMTTVARERL